MPTRRMLLMSSSRYHQYGFLSFAHDQFKLVLDDKKFEILFIPYAFVKGPYDQFEDKVKAVFEPLGHTIKSIHHFEDKVAAVKNAQVILVGGGNTWALMKQMYEDGIVEAIRDRVNEGAPYIGWSAGGNVAGPTIRTTNDMPIAMPPSFNAFGLIPFQTNPHFIGGTTAGLNNETREDRLQEFIAYNPTEELLALPEGTALLVEDDMATVVGPEDQEDLYWFRQNGNKTHRIERIKRGTRFALTDVAPGKTIG